MLTINEIIARCSCAMLIRSPAASLNLASRIRRPCAASFHAAAQDQSRVARRFVALFVAAGKIESQGTSRGCQNPFPGVDKSASLLTPRRFKRVNLQSARHRDLVRSTRARETGLEGGGREFSLRERGSSRLLLSRVCIFFVPSSSLLFHHAWTSRRDEATCVAVASFPDLRRFSRRFIADRLIRKQRSRELQ